MNRFKIDAPPNQEGIVVLVFKYITLFIIVWLLAWFIIYFMLLRKEILADLIWENLFIANILISTLIFSFFILRVREKFIYGVPFELEFGDKYLKIKSINTISYKIIKKEIPLNNLMIRELRKDNNLIGKNRVIKIYNGHKLISILKVDLTAWNKNKNIEELIEKLKILGTTKAIPHAGVQWFGGFLCKKMSAIAAFLVLVL